jgi:hypothetical protein
MSRKARWDWNEMGPISSWYMLKMWIYWVTDNTDAIKKNTETLIGARKEVL